MRLLLPLALFATATLSACAPQVQTTSGADYLAARPFTDPALAAIANIEPTLTFPARIGVARVYDGRLSNPTAAEMALWEDLFTRAASFGSFVPMTSLTADLSGDTVGGSWRSFDLNQAQQLGARLHLDYVLVVDVTGESGAAQAAFIDVRTGYPYGSAQAAVAGGQVNGFFGGLPNNPSRRDAVTLDLTRAIIPEIADLLGSLAAAQNGR